MPKPITRRRRKLMATPAKTRGTRGDRVRISVYIPTALSARMQAVLTAQYGTEHKPYGVVTALVTQLLEQYVEHAELRVRKT